MGKEIERKYLLKNSEWKSHVSKSYSIQQGYLNSDPERTVRIRLRDDEGILTIKGKNEGISRQEFEYPIPIEEAKELIKLCTKPLIKKTRNLVIIDNQTWEIDEFDGDHKGLTLAEIELRTEEEVVNLPDWIGMEVSDDPRYYNSNLAQSIPYALWES